MNTKIAKALLNTPDDELDEQSIAIIKAHNDAASYGFIELPALEFFSTFRTNNETMITVRPRPDSVNINDLYILKQTWGADDLNVLDEGIEIVFKK